MGPRKTEYRLAVDPTDYARCHALMKRNRYASDRLGWPTVLAIRDGKVLGFISTHRRRDTVMAGPLVVDGNTASPFLVLRLIEGYEKVLSATGVRYYWFTAETEGMQRTVQKLMSKFGGVIEVSRSEDGSILYRRNLME
jgi:hypothetical protein